MRVILRSPARIHSSPEVFRRAVWQLGSCVSFSPPQSRLTLLLFSLLHACHSCRPLRQRQRAAFFVRAAPLQSIFRHIFPAPCVMMCAFLRPQVLRHHPPSCGCGRTHRALRNILPPPRLMTWSNPRTTHSPRWPPWLPTEAETGSLWS